MSSCRAVIRFLNTSSIFLGKCVNFSFKKELYTPYTVAVGVFLMPEIDVDFSDISGISFYVNETRIHFGMPDRVNVFRRNGLEYVSILSRSHTMLLGQNEPEPGVISNVTLAQLITSNIQSDYISAQENTQNQDYIFVKEKSTIWDAINIYALKTYNTVPYIKGYNTVMVTADNAAEVDYSNAKIIGFGGGKDTTLALSDIYMSEFEQDTYPYEATNAALEQMNIRRKRYYAMDKQWLQSPLTGLKYKLRFSRRKSAFVNFSYAGFQNEDIMQKVTNLDPRFNGKFINALSVTGNSGGIFTQVCCYDDYYGQNQEESEDD